MYRLVMAIRPEALPTDAAADRDGARARRREREAARGDADAQGHDLREALGAACGAGRRAVCARLGDLETGVTPPEAANDDVPAAKPSGKEPRKKARRNIGALPKHLPRCEQVLEPDTTGCPCCRGEPARRSARTSARCWT